MVGEGCASGLERGRSKVRRRRVKRIEKNGRTGNIGDAEAINGLVS